jgi:hypothetical protein
VPPDPREADYIRAIERRYGLLRRRPLLLSPADFERVRAWYEKGVPLFLVLEILDELFERARASSAPAPRSLRYCETAILEGFRAWQDNDLRPAREGAPVGPSEGPAEEDLLESARHAVATSDAPDALRAEVVTLLETWAEAAPPPEAGDVASRLDRRLVEACLGELDADERARLEGEADAEIAPFAAEMDPSVRDRARWNALARRVRRRFRLPHLGTLPLLS